MAKILLTGATGFIGRTLLPRLVSADHDVACPVRVPSSIAGTGARSIKMDLSAAVDVGRLPESIDAVILLAQSPRYRDFPDGVSDMTSVNVSATASLLAWAYAVGCGRAVLASSGNVYEPYDRGFAEETPINPDSYYAATKAAAEKLLFGYRNIMKVSALRLFFPYGPGQTARVIPRLIEAIRDGNPVTLAGSKDGIKLTPTYVDDVADVFVAALEEEWEGAVNVASPEVVSMRNLARMIGGLIGKPPIFDQLGGEEPRPLVPVLERLSDRYDLRRFRPLGLGLAETVRAGKAVGALKA